MIKREDGGEFVNIKKGEMTAGNIYCTEKAHHAFSILATEHFLKVKGTICLFLALQIIGQGLNLDKIKKNAAVELKIVFSPSFGQLICDACLKTKPFLI